MPKPPDVPENLGVWAELSPETQKYIQDCHRWLWWFVWRQHDAASGSLHDHLRKIKEDADARA